jgi:hypothetical protein
LFPLRITEDKLLIYNRRIELIAEHRLLASSRSGEKQVDPSHRAPRNQQIQLEVLQERFAEFGEMGARYLQGLLGRQRYGKHQAQRVLVLCRSYAREEVLAALERAVRFHAYSYSSLERILSILGTPKPPWQACTEEQEKFFEELDGIFIGPRDSSEYQHLLFDEKFSDDEKDSQEPQNGEIENDPTQRDERQDHAAGEGEPENDQQQDGQREDDEPEDDPADE